MRMTSHIVMSLIWAFFSVNSVQSSTNQDLNDTTYSSVANVSKISTDRFEGEFDDEVCGPLTREKCEDAPYCFCSKDIPEWESCLLVCKGRMRSEMCKTEDNCKKVDGSPSYVEATPCNASCSSPSEVIEGTTMRLGYRSLNKICDDCRPDLGGHCCLDSPESILEECKRNMEDQCRKEEEDEKRIKVYIVIGAVVGFFIVIVIILVLFKKAKKNEKKLRAMFWPNKSERVSDEEEAVDLYPNNLIGQRPGSD